MIFLIITKYISIMKILIKILSYKGPSSFDLYYSWWIPIWKSSAHRLPENWKFTAEYRLYRISQIL